MDTFKAQKKADMRGVGWNNKDWFYPPRVFEAQTGLKGIAGGWVMPEWLNDTSCDDIYQGWNLKKFIDVWMEVTELNPILSYHMFEVRDIRAIVLGVLSDINMFDVARYLRMMRTQSFGEELETVVKARVRAKLRMEVDIQWRLSVPTASRILRALGPLQEEQ